MKSIFRKSHILFALLGILLFGSVLGCRQNTKPAWESDAQAQVGEEISDRAVRPTENTNTRNAPDYVYDVWDYVRANGRAMKGYVGGRTFYNREKRLPKTSVSGKKIKYREWDVHRKIKGKNRGAERLVTGSDGAGYYTKDHYRSFTRLK